MDCSASSYLPIQILKKSEWEASPPNFIKKFRYMINQIFEMENVLVTREIVISKVGRASASRTKCWGRDLNSHGCNSASS